MSSQLPLPVKHPLRPVLSCPVYSSPSIPYTMFRTALVRSARCLAQAAPRAQAPTVSRIVPSTFAASRTAAPSAMIPSFRCYSAHAGLSQDEVQGRILDLLKNFDKVCCCCLACWTAMPNPFQPSPARPGSVCI